MTPTNHVSTHTVMANGVHTSKPAKRYFLNGISGRHKKRHTMQRWWSWQRLLQSWYSRLQQKKKHQKLQPMLQHQLLLRHPLQLQA
jgi:hypothetical protein